MSIRLAHTIDLPDWITSNLHEATKRINQNHDHHTDRWHTNYADWTLRVSTERIEVNYEHGERETLPGLTRARLEIGKGSETWELEWDNYTIDWVPMRYTIGGD